MKSTNRNGSAKNSSDSTNNDDDDKKPPGVSDFGTLAKTSASSDAGENNDTSSNSLQASRTHHSFSDITSNQHENTNDLSHRTTRSLSVENPPRYDPNFDPSEASVSSTGSKGSKAKKKTQRIERPRPRQPPIGNVTIPASSGQSSLSTLSNTIQQAVQRPSISRQNSLSNSQRSYGCDSSSSVASNISTSSRRIGLMGRLLAEMHLIERECFDDDQEHDDEDYDDENIDDDRWLS